MKAFLHILNSMKLKERRNGARRFSILVLLFFLVISFQNCSQGKFEVPSTGTTGVDSTSVGSSTSSTTSQTPEQIAAAAALAAEQAAIEAARQQRCKDGIQKPIITNASTINGMNFSFNVGLGAGSGDSVSSSQDVNVDASKGVKSTVDPADNCTYSTTLRISAVDPANDPSRPAVFSEGINMDGTPRLIDATNTVFKNASSAVRTNPGGNNNSFATTTVAMKFDNITQNRAIRCATGSLYYKAVVRVSTSNLNQNANLDSDPVYVKVNFSNSCWIESKLLSTADYPLNANAGSKVALDGSWAAVLAPKDGNVGAVYIFNNPGSGWIFKQKISNPDPNNGFLSNVVLKDSVLAISNASYNSIGKVSVYRWNGSNWSLSQNLASADPSVLSQQFGLGLALDGGMLAVGAPSHPRSGVGDTGRVFIYKDNGSSFSYLQALDGATTANYGFGQAIAISGSRMIVGAPGAVGLTNYSGQAFVFSYSSNWTQTKVLSPIAPISDGANFGASVAISNSIVAVGAPLHDEGNNTDNGKIYFYNDFNGALTHSIAGKAGVKLGTSVGLNSDSLFVGSVVGGASLSGVVERYLFSTLNSSTTTDKNKVAFIQFSQDATASEYFGQSLSVSGSTIIIGAPAKSVPNDKGGAAYIYSIR